ncbi:MAG: DNA polymerase III subunit beta [Proteobacteria bacterium]|nr:DNA polymerase III subunit beta [Pseudomonadota bacterium]
MKFSINRETLLRPLQQVAAVVERRQTLPVLANILMQVTENQLSMTGTDLEVELIGRVDLTGANAGDITVPARKMLDICREIPDKADIEFHLMDQKLEIKSGRFRSTLSTLPAEDFPLVGTAATEMSLTLDCKAFKKLLDRTSFAMAQQDVRYFLNGMLIEFGPDYVRSVATDGHRLAMANLDVELEGDVEISIGARHLCSSSSEYTLTMKLVDGRFPEYERVIPKNGDKIIHADKLELHQALNRTAILSNEKFRGIRVTFSRGSIQLSANNPEQEEAEETVSVEYDGEALEIGFNVSYLQDVLAVLESDRVRITVHDGNSSALLEDPENEDAIYVVMPMKL